MIFPKERKTTKASRAHTKDTSFLTSRHEYRPPVKRVR